MWISFSSGIIRGIKPWGCPIDITGLFNVASKLNYSYYPSLVTGYRVLDDIRRLWVPGPCIQSLSSLLSTVEKNEFKLLAMSDTFVSTFGDLYVNAVMTNDLWIFGTVDYLPSSFWHIIWIQ